MLNKVTVLVDKQTEDILAPLQAHLEHLSKIHLLTINVQEMQNNLTAMQDELAEIKDEFADSIRDITRAVNKLAMDDQASVLAAFCDNLVGVLQDGKHDWLTTEEGNKVHG